MVLVVALVFLVVALRLPVGARPRLELGASSASATPPGLTAGTTPFDQAIAAQTRADLEAVVATTLRVYPLWKSYRPATPAVLSGALPQFGFVTGTHASTRVGELSVATSQHEITLAEYAGPDACAFARVTAKHGAQTAPGMTGTACRASVPPTDGWTRLG
jgi:hypothetical protein